MSLLTILVTLGVLGYNLFQLSAAYTWVLAQIGEYRNFVQTEQVTPARLRRFNVLMTLAMLVAYLVLLYFSGFAFWLLSSVGIKYLLTLFLSDRVQERILSGKPFSSLHHMLLKVDSLFNVLMLSFVLYVSVSP